LSINGLSLTLRSPRKSIKNEWQQQKSLNKNILDNASEATGSFAQEGKEKVKEEVEGFK
jgi:hypothetical protein